MFVTWFESHCLNLKVGFNLGEKCTFKLYHVLITVEDQNSTCKHWADYYKHSLKLKQPYLPKATSSFDDVGRQLFSIKNPNPLLQKQVIVEDSLIQQQQSKQPRETASYLTVIALRLVNIDRTALELADLTNDPLVWQALCDSVLPDAFKVKLYKFL